MGCWNKSQKLDCPMKIQAYGYAVIDRIVPAKLFIPPHFTLKSVPGWALNSMGTLVIGSWSSGRYSRTKFQALREAMTRRNQVPTSQTGSEDI